MHEQMNHKPFLSDSLYMKLLMVSPSLSVDGLLDDHWFHVGCVAFLVRSFLYRDGKL